METSGLSVLIAGCKLFHKLNLYILFCTFFCFRISEGGRLHEHLQKLFK